MAAKIEQTRTANLEPGTLVRIVSHGRKLYRVCGVRYPEGTAVDVYGPVDRWDTPTARAVHHTFGLAEVAAARAMPPVIDVAARAAAARKANGNGKAR